MSEQTNDYQSHTSQKVPKPWMYRLGLDKSDVENATTIEKAEAFASKARDKIRDFIENVKKHPRQNPDDFDEMKEEMEEIADYFDTHSDHGCMEEIDYNLDALYNCGDQYRIIIWSK